MEYPWSNLRFDMIWQLIESLQFECLNKFRLKSHLPQQLQIALPNTAKDARGSARKSPRGASNRVRGGNAMRVVHPNERLANQSNSFQEHVSWYTIHQLIHESYQDLSSCHGSFFSMSLIKYWIYQFVKNDSSIEILMVKRSCVVTRLDSMVNSDSVVGRHWFHQQPSQPEWILEKEVPATCFFVPPPKKMTMENPPFEDAFPIENGHFPM